MVTRGTIPEGGVHMPEGKTRFFIRDDSGGDVIEVILHRPVPEALLAGHLFQFEEELRTSHRGGPNLSAPVPLQRAARRHLQSL